VANALFWILVFVVPVLASWVARGVASQYYSKDENRAVRSRWLQVSGIITDSNVAINGRDERPNWNMSLWFHGERPHWYITVTFTYVVKGVQCAGAQRWYTRSNDKVGAQEELLEYLAGETVIVHHNQTPPGRLARLPEPRFNVTAWAPSMLSMVTVPELLNPAAEVSVAAPPASEPWTSRLCPADMSPIRVLLGPLIWKVAADVPPTPRVRVLFTRLMTGFPTMEPPV
jgi:hypothetical protein